jgi:hypothetical protein
MTLITSWLTCIKSMVTWAYVSYFFLHTLFDYTLYMHSYMWHAMITTPFLALNAAKLHKKQIQIVWSIIKRAEPLGDGNVGRQCRHWYITSWLTRIKYMLFDTCMHTCEHHMINTTPFYVSEMPEGTWLVGNHDPCQRIGEDRKP